MILKTNRQISAGSLILLLVFVLLLSVSLLLLRSHSSHASPVTAESSGAGIHGVYLYAIDRAAPVDITNSKALITQFLNSSTAENVSGLEFVTDWADVEPSPGQFSFSYFDQQLAALAAINANRLPSDPLKAVIGITFENFPTDPSWNTSDSPCLQGYGLAANIACPSFPAWFLNEINGNAITSITSDWGMVDGCLPTRIPYPWDPIFISEWTKLVQAFGAWEQANPDKNLVAGVELTALPYFNYSNNLPVQDPTPKNATCTTAHRLGESVTLPIPNDVNSWESAGYKPSLVEDAFEKIVSTYASSFPGLHMEIESGPNSLPPINETGQTNNSDDSPQLLQIASSVLGPSLIVVGNMSLTNVRSIDAAYSDGLGTGEGNHLGWAVSTDTACLITKGTGLAAPACEGPEVMQAVFQEDEAGGGSFFKIDLPDATDPSFAKVLAVAHQFLTSSSSGEKLIPADAQDLATKPWSLAHTSISSSNAVQPPITAKGIPPLQFLQEDGANATHAASGTFTLAANQTYAFAIWAKSDNRWIEIDVGNASALYDPSTGKIKNGANQAPNILGAQTFGPKGDWQELVLVFKTKSNQVPITVKLVDPKNSSNDYQGDGSSGAYLWAPQLLPIQNSLGS